MKKSTIECASCEYALQLSSDQDLWCFLGNPTSEGVCQKYKTAKENENSLKVSVPK